MTTDALLAQLSARGALVKASGNQLRIEAPTGVITPELLEVLKEQKGKILRLLSAKPRECLETESRFGHRQATLYPLLEPFSNAGPSSTGLSPSVVSDTPRDSLREEDDPEVPAVPASNYLQFSDINDRDRILTIERVVHPDFNGKVQPAVEFREIGKGLVLDAVNLDAIEEKYGADLDDWIEKRIQLYASGSDRAIRIRPCCRNCRHWNGYMEGGYCGGCYLKLGVHRRVREQDQEVSDNGHQ